MWRVRLHSVVARRSEYGRSKRPMINERRRRTFDARARRIPHDASAHRHGSGSSARCSTWLQVNPTLSTLTLDDNWVIGEEGAAAALAEVLYTDPELRPAYFRGEASKETVLGARQAAQEAADKVRRDAWLLSTPLAQLPFTIRAAHPLRMPPPVLLPTAK